MVLMTFHFWDAGDRALGDFPHMREACQSNVDVALVVFSLADRASWDEVSLRVARYLEQYDKGHYIIIGTNADQPGDNGVTAAEVRDWASRRPQSVPVHFVNGAPGQNPTREQLYEVITHK